MPGPTGGASAAAVAKANAQEAATANAEALQAGFNVSANTVRPEPVASLPAASLAQVGRLLIVPGTGSTADVVSICLKSATNSYSWKTLATG